MDNSQAEQMAPRMNMQESILVMGLQETPTKKWDKIKRQPHSKYAKEKGLRLLATLPTIVKKRCTQKGRTKSPESKSKTHQAKCTDELI